MYSKNGVFFIYFFFISSDAGPSQKQQEHWDGIKQYLDVNDHLKGVGPGKYAQKVTISTRLSKLGAECCHKPVKLHATPQVCN